MYMYAALHVHIPCVMVQVTSSLCFEMFWTWKFIWNSSFDLPNSKIETCYVSTCT